MTVEERWKLYNPFTQADRNLALRVAFDAGGRHWIDVWLPKRFTNYARGVLKYRVTGKYETAKRNQNGVADPLVWSGKFQEQALSMSYPVAKVTNGRQSLIIRIPAPPYTGYKPVVRRTVAGIPDIEQNRVAEVVSKTLVGLLNDGIAQLPDAPAKQRKNPSTKPRRLWTKPQRSVLSSGLGQRGSHSFTAEGSTNG